MSAYQTQQYLNPLLSKPLELGDRSVFACQLIALWMPISWSKKQIDRKPLYQSYRDQKGQKINKELPRHNLQTNSKFANHQKSQHRNQYKIVLVRYLSFSADLQESKREMCKNYRSDKKKLQKSSLFVCRVEIL